MRGFGRFCYPGSFVAFAKNYRGFASTEDAEQAEEPKSENPNELPDLELKTPKPRPVKPRTVRVCFLGVLLFLLGVTSLVIGMSFILHNRHHHKIDQDDEVVMIPAHVRGPHDRIRIDSFRETVYVQQVRVTEGPAFTSLHNYKKGFAAHRDDGKKKCYIDRITKTFREEYRQWTVTVKSKAHLPMVVEGAAMHKSVLLYVVGQAIVEHCNGYPAFWIHPATDEKVKAAQPLPHKQQNTFVLRRPKPVHHPEPHHKPGPDHRIELHHKPGPDSRIESHHQPGPHPGPDAHHKPGPHPGPDAHHKPGPHPGPDAHHKPGPHPGPDAHHKPGPHPGPDAHHKPGPHPGPDAHHKPGPHPGPDAHHKPEPHPGPDVHHKRGPHHGARPHHGPGPHHRPGPHHGPGPHHRPGPHYEPTRAPWWPRPHPQRASRSTTEHPPVTKTTTVTTPKPTTTPYYHVRGHLIDQGGLYPGGRYNKQQLPRVKTTHVEIQHPSPVHRIGEISPKSRLRPALGRRLGLNVRNVRKPGQIRRKWVPSARREFLQRKLHGA